MKNEYVLEMIDEQGSFLTKEGTKICKCLFVSTQEDTWEVVYLPSTKVELHAIYVPAFKLKGSGNYKLTFNKKEV